MLTIRVHAGTDPDQGGQLDGVGLADPDSSIPARILEESMN